MSIIIGLCLRFMLLTPIVTFGAKQWSSKNLNRCIRMGTAVLKQRINGPVSLTWDPVSFWITLDKDQRMTLTSGTCTAPCTHLIYYIYHLLIIDFNSFWVIHHWSVFPHKCIRNQSWLLHKKMKGQPRVIIWRNLVVLECPVLYIMFQPHLPDNSKEEDFLRFLPYMGMVAILVMWPAGSFEQIFIPPFEGGSTWNLTDWPSGFWGDVWKC